MDYCDNPFFYSAYGQELVCEKFHLNNRVLILAAIDAAFFIVLTGQGSGRRIEYNKGLFK